MDHRNTAILLFSCCDTTTNNYQYQHQQNTKTVNHKENINNIEIPVTLSIKINQMLLA